MRISLPHHRYVTALSWRTLLALWLWWILAEGEGGGWGFGLAFALLAALASLPLLPPAPWPPLGPTLRGLLRFIPFFLWQSLQGGVDVARRAFHPRLPLAPAIIHYPLSLAPGWPRIFFLNTISLLPGTLAVSLQGDRVQVHLLDGRGDPHKALRQVEERVADLFIPHKHAMDEKENG